MLRLHYACYSRLLFGVGFLLVAFAEGDRDDPSTETCASDQCSGHADQHYVKLRFRPGTDPDVQRLQSEVENSLSQKQLQCRTAAECCFAALAASRTFREVFWEQKPFVMETARRGSPGPMKGLWTAAKNAKILRGEALFTDPSIKSRSVHSFQLEPGKKKESGLTKEAFSSKLKDATFVQSGAEGLYDPLAILSRDAERAFGLPASSNTYISSLDKDVTAPLHTDRMNSFIIQTEGAKRWRIFDAPPTLRYPVPDAGVEELGKHGHMLVLENVGDMLIDELLSASTGDVAYLPRGFPHATSTFDTAQHCKDKKLGRYSTSLTLSLLSESVSLTNDKLLRCLGGIAGECRRGEQCAEAEAVWSQTKEFPSLRKTLPIGFLNDAGGSEMSQHWVAVMLEQIANLTAQMKTTDAYPNTLPSTKKQRAVLTHFYNNFQAAMANGGEGAVRLPTSEEEEKKRTERLGGLYRSLWPKKCHIFVEPAVVHSQRM
mmetsp:Transcript_155161/g.268825  ORF Transcript_155161/g.268825 Transcript_155161/m.268825 type:complete len:488 (-) Transcript_155161:193-1656(-)